MKTISEEIEQSEIEQLKKRLLDFEGRTFSENEEIKKLQQENAELKAVEHQDDEAINFFCKQMKLKMKKSREKGRSGWDECPPEILSKMLHDHVSKGDPIDVANFCMMLFMNGHPIASDQKDQTIKELVETIKEIRLKYHGYIVARHLKKIDEALKKAGMK